MNILKIKELAKNRVGGLKKLATDIGMSEANLHRCINANRIEASDLEQIAKELEVPIETFFDIYIKTGDITFSDNKQAMTNIGTRGNPCQEIHGITEDTLNSASLGYQDVIKTYQNHTEKLLNVINKLIEKYER